MKFGLSDEQLKQVQAVLSKFPAVTEAIVFGSRAMGNYKEASDVDLALKGKVTSLMAADVKYALEEDTYLPFFFDVVAYRGIDTQRLKDHIDRYGVALYRAGWMEYRFSDFVEITPRVSLQRGVAYPFVEMADLNNGQRYCTGAVKRVFGSGSKFQDSDTLFARITPCLENGKICQVRNLEGGKGFGSTEFHVFRGRDGVSDPDFVYYLARCPDVREFAEANLHGTSGRQRVPSEAFDNLYLNLPPIAEQRFIATTLSSLDRKIELLRDQNKTLDGMAAALWRTDVIDIRNPNWEETRLDRIASFLNGLPCQKYPPDNSSPALPVIKIKELNSGITDASDMATSNVPSQFIVDDGDVLFSWSGSLELKIWSSGRGVLNQHLFKVTSDNYPKWFYFYWIRHHLPEFRDIAQDKATTMGHIQRHHLSDARVLVPDPGTFRELDERISPLFEKIIQNQSAAHRLGLMRDELLSKLIFGDLKAGV